MLCGVVLVVKNSLIFKSDYKINTKNTLIKVMKRTKDKYQQY